jgi:transposase
MLSKEDWMSIQAQRTRGVYQKDIAWELGVHPRTVRRALARGGAPSGKRPGARKSKLDPFKGEVDRLLQEGVWNGRVIFLELRGKGYTGKRTILQDYLRPKRVLRKGRATVRFETAPGEQMQNDWGEVWTEIAGKKAKVYFSVNTLGYSRRFHFWCTDKQDAEHTYEGIVRAFEYFGGTTAEVLVDNQKSLVIANRIGDRVQFHERFVDLAGHYGFTPRACRPYRARTKGKDERMVGYIEHHFFVRYRSFASFAHLNQVAEEWLREEADPRVQGTVKEVVSERFAREAPHLVSLPAVRYDTSYREMRLVGWDGYVDIRGNRYSAPDPFRGQRVTVRIRLDGTATILSDDDPLVEHQLRPVSEGWGTVPEHHASLWRETLHVERRDLAVYEEVGACSS